MNYANKPNYAREDEPTPTAPAAVEIDFSVPRLRELASQLKGVVNERQKLLQLVAQARQQAVDVVNEADEILETFSPKDMP